MIFELAEDYADALAAMPPDHAKRRTLELFEEAIRRDIQFIDRHPTTLFQCMWNTCWWYDSPAAEQHYLEPEAGWEVTQPPWRLPKPRLSDRLDDWRRARENAVPGTIWIRSMRPPAVSLGGPLRNILRGHRPRTIISSVAFSSDSAQVVSSSKDKTIRIWQVETGRELAVHTGHNDEVYGAAFTRDDRFIVSGSADFTGRVTDVSTGDAFCIQSDFSLGTNIAVSPIANVAAYGDYSGDVYVWDFEAGSTETLPTQTDERVEVVAFSKDGKRLASGFNDGTVQVWDLRRRRWPFRRKASIIAHPGKRTSIRGIVFADDERYLLAAYDTGVIRKWDLETQDVIHEIKLEDKISACAFAPGCDRIATAKSKNPLLKLWRVADGSPVATFRGHSATIVCITFAPDGTKVAAGSMNGLLLVWSTESTPPQLELNDHAHSVRSLAFSVDVDTLATGADNGSIRIWDTKTGVQTGRFVSHQHRVTSLAFARSGHHLLSASKSNAVISDSTSGATLVQLIGQSFEQVQFSDDGRHVVECVDCSEWTNRPFSVWDAEKGSIRHSFPDSSFPAYSADGKRIITAATDSTVRLYEAGSNAIALDLVGHEDDVKSIAFSPDGNQIATAGGCSIRVWDARSGSPIRELRGHESSVRCIAFSPDGQDIASASADKTLRIWSLATGEVTGLLQADDEFTSVAFSADGARVSAGSFDHSVYIVNGRDGALLHSLRGHQALIGTVAYSSDGYFLLSSAVDGAIRLWNAKTHTPIRTIREPGQVNIAQLSTNAVTISPDSTRILAPNAEAGLTLFDVESGAEIRRLHQPKTQLKAGAFSPDGRQILTRSDYGGVFLWDTETDSEPYPLPCEDPNALAIAFAPDGARIAVGMRTYNAHVWDSTSFEERALLRGHRRPLTSIAINEQFDLIATASSDGTLRLWDYESGRLRKELWQGDTPVTAAAFDPSGPCLFMGTQDGTVRRLDVRSGNVLDEFRGLNDAVSDIVASDRGNVVIATSIHNKNNGPWNDAIAWNRPTGGRLERLERVHGREVANWVRDGLDRLMIADGSETGLYRTDTLQAISWLPESLLDLNANRDGSIWAGARANYVAILQIEGNISSL